MDASRAPALSIEGLVKRFGRTEALAGIDLVLDRPGKYRVEWEYSVSPEAAGNAWLIEIGGKEVLSGTVAGTGSWETFKTETLGTLDLPAADNHVVVRSKGPVKGALLDLRVVRLVPVTAAP